MDAAFERILELSLSGGVIALVVLCLRPLLRHAPKRVLCLLWMIAVLRLLVPFEIQSNWSLQPELLAPPAQTQPHTGGFDAAPPPETEAVPPSFVEDAVTYPVTTPPQEEPAPTNLLPTLWLLGVTILGIHGCVSYLHLKRRVRNAVIFEEGVWLCPGLDTAFVLGFFRPQIYLPVLTEEERELVLCHERCHLRRLDHWWKLAAYCAVCIHWFNPMAWVTYVLLCRDMEMACDQETIKNMTNAQRRAYSAALLRCAAKRSGIAVCPMAFGEISVKARIKTVLNYKKPAFWVTIIALIAALAVGIFFLTEPADDPVQTLYEELDKLQTSECYHLVIDQEFDTDYWAWSTAQQEFLKVGNNWSRIFDTKTAHGDTFVSSYLCYEGKMYGQKYSDTGLFETEPWGQIEDLGYREPLSLDWKAMQVLDVRQNPDGSTVITLQPELISNEERVDYSNIYEFHMDKEGTLAKLVNSYHISKHISGNGPYDVKGIETYHIQNTPINEITSRINAIAEEAIAAIHSDDAHDILAELEPAENPVQTLYKELDKLQAADSVHLTIDMTIDSNYDGWDTCNQEYLKSGDDWYRNFVYTTSSGGHTTSFVHRGGITYAREEYEDGTIPEQNWERLNREMDSALPLLSRDWRTLEVYATQTEPDGSAVITLQGDLTPTEDTVYEEKTYEFHLTPEGKLDYMVTNSTYTKEISEQSAHGTFQFREMDMIRFLDTSPDQITARINAIAEEATASIHSDDAHEILAELDLMQEELRLAEKCYNAYAELLTAQDLHMVTSIHSSTYEGEVVSEEGFYSGRDYCFQRCSWYSDVPVATQAVMVDGSLYSCTVQGNFLSGWQPQALTNEYSYHPRQMLDSWDISGLLRAEEQGDGILLTFYGEPRTYADTDYYTVNGYTIRFRFDGDALREVTWEYDLHDDGTRGSDHRIETYTYPAASPDAIREKIGQLYAESQTPCTFPYAEFLDSIEEQWHVLQQGFQNTAPSPIENRDDAVRIAARELTKDYHTASVFYDPDAEVWMVCFGLYTTGDFLVFLNADGTTCMTIQFPTGETFALLNHTCENPAHHHTIPIG